MFKYYNRNTKPLSNLNEGDKVFYKKQPNSIWSPGIISKKCNEPRSYLIKDESGNLYRRNRQHITPHLTPCGI